MSDYGFKVSKAGYDVLTADIKDQIINSEANSLKTFTEGSSNISVSAYSGAGTGIGSATINHALGYKPFFLTYYRLDDPNMVYFQDSYDNTIPILFTRGFSYATDDDLILNVQSQIVTGWTAKAYYMIFIDKSYE